MRFFFYRTLTSLILEGLTFLAAWFFLDVNAGFSLNVCFNATLFVIFAAYLVQGSIAVFKLIDLEEGYRG